MLYFICDKFKILSNFSFDFWFDKRWSRQILVSNTWRFYAYVLLHISNLILLWLKNVYCMFLNIRFIETYFVPQNMVYLAKCFVYIWKVCVLLLYSEVFYKCQWGQVYWQCYSHLLYPYWFSLCSVNYWEKNLKISNQNCRFYFSL